MVLLLRSLHCTCDQTFLWIPELGLKLKDSATLKISFSGLSPRVVDAAQILLKRQFTVEGLHSAPTPWSEICPVSGPAVQIHVDIDWSHCFTSCYRSGRVELVYSFPREVSQSIL
ncbi:hypothetical protein XELAEV_18011827mg [Xenopus laevis]|uniref:Uncharacterized protein n=1 Tax=Xenopus laevis TaxID=8355 RepID=A0A974DNV0_XENLA|nr:hypothetical protein XELAEV_18011827mg [Xenopus laevis]